MERNSNVPLIAAALIVGASILGAAVLIEQSLKKASNEIAALRLEISRQAVAKPTAAAQPGRRGPDPQARHRVEVSGSPAKGPARAKVTLVEFSDFQCPFCRRVNPTIERIQKEYGDQVRVVFKHLPLSIHPKAPAAHAAAEAAHRQGKFWEMHDAIFADQAGMSPARYKQYAEKLGLDLVRFERDVASQEVKDRVNADIEQAERLGVSGTPAFFVNGRFVSGALPFASFKRLIDDELKG